MKQFGLENALIMWCLFALLIFPNFFISYGYVAKSFNNIFDNELVGKYSFSPEVKDDYVPQPPQDVPLWVLRLGTDEFDDLKLRIASYEEEEDFYYAVEPLIERLEGRGPPHRIRKKQSAEEPVQDDNADTNTKLLKRDIMKIVNKFVLSTNIEPDTFLTETEDENVASLALYFKGPYTSLVVRHGINQWHFFITPSPFPDWFYEDHLDANTNGPEIYVDVPKSVQKDFYKVLLHTIQVFLGFPL